MPITTTYPGIYIEELPSTARTITPAPTSITVFVGYTHPYKTRNFNVAVQIFSYADYEREFGGLYQSGVVANDVAYAVNDFFLNGGSNAYVVGLLAAYWDGASPPSKTPLTPSSQSIGGITFTAREPTDLLPIEIEIKPRTSSPPPTEADILIKQGSRAETFRGVTLAPDKPTFIEHVIGTSATPVSSLVTVESPSSTASFPTGITNVTLQDQGPSAGFVQTFSAGDFTGVFDADQSLDKVDVFNLMAIPGVTVDVVWSAALAFCERKMAFLIVDPPSGVVSDPQGGVPPAIQEVIDAGQIPLSPNGALYFPNLISHDPITGDITERPPSGHVAGMYAKTDVRRGVWKAPAGLETILLDTGGPVANGRMTDMRQGELNRRGINALRAFPGTGTVIFGARTLVGATDNTAFQQWRYVPVRRTALFIEQTLYANLKWVTFEPNDEPLWTAIRTSIEAFMLGLFNQGAFQGSKPSRAFFVTCDATTTTQADIDNGRVNIVVGFRPLKPAEFVIVQIAQIAGQAEA